ncbi:nucleolin 1-like isoform X1 [Lolium rigidum]|uniref:nucleolin 1-like isoform X1 n=2 Tax=Lolium rigidum TaxID=89674 RepID=UPI001F5DC29A|nr:nucleolin 1-like isoform X1 [Lolium rigidum]
MGQEADADEQLRRRLRRVFAAEERSFRMDRRSEAATALRAAVADVLPRFLGTYSDDTLAEYIVILVCNGKHQYQARDDLEAFLGDDSAKFVAWLWGYLSKRSATLADDSSVQHGVESESRNLNDKKNLLVTKTQPGDARIVNSKVLTPQEHKGLQKLDSIKGQNVAQRRISSTVIVSPEMLVGDNGYWDGPHQKKDWNSTDGRSSMRKSGVASKTEHALTQEELHDEYLGANASTRRLPVAVATDDGEVSESMKRRRNVWDRLGKPAVEDQGLPRETDNMHVENRMHKKAKLPVSEHERRTDGDLFDRANSGNFSSSYPDVNTVRPHEHREKFNRSRLSGRLDFGDVDRNHHQVRDFSSQKSTPTLPVKKFHSQSLNEFTSEVKSSSAALSEPARLASNSFKGHVSASNNSSQLNTRLNSGTDVLQSQQINSPAQSKSGSSVREDGSSYSNKPVKDEMLDVKLKLKQVELDMLKLRSKQAQINNGKQGSLPSGPHTNLEEDADARTVLVTNVHFAATKEALSTHFMQCGTVLKINMLTDAITGHPKGAAYITFADNESIGRAISLSGTSFYSRVLTVLRKADAPPGYLAPIQQTGRPQAWNSPPFHKGVSPKQSSGHHLQWKREQSAMENSPANCPTS